MVMGEHEKRLHELSLIALADSNPGSLGRPGQGGQQQRGQDGDDGNHHQQFNERKTTMLAFQGMALHETCVRHRRVVNCAENAVRKGLPAILP